MIRRVALLNPPWKRGCFRDLYCSLTTRGNYCWAPIDLLVISGRLAPSFDLFVLDAVASGLSSDEAFRRAAAFEPEAIVSLAGSASLAEDMEWLGKLKETTGARMVVLGDVSLDSGVSLLRKRPWIDALVHDFISPDLSEYLKNPENFSSPRGGLTVRNGGRLIGNWKPGFPADRSFSYPVPRHDLFPLKKYRIPYVSRYPMATLLASYGCIYDCGYCVYSREILSPRCRSIENVLEEMDYLKRLGVKELYFRDPIFGGNRTNATALCRAMKEREYRFAWSCDMRVEVCDENLVRAMGEAGCHCLAFGIETLNRDVIRNYRKEIDRRSIERAVELCHKHGILAAGYFIVGLPRETYRSVEETIDFAVDSGLDYASFSVPTPEFATPLREEAVKEGWIPGDCDQFDRGTPGKEICSTLSRGEIQTLFRQAYRRTYLRPSRMMGILKRVGSFRQLYDVFLNGCCVLKRIFRSAA